MVSTKFIAESLKIDQFSLRVAFGSVEISGGIQASDLVQSSLKCLIPLRGHIINRVDVRKVVPGKSVGNKFVDGIGTSDILVNVCLQSAGTVAFLQ